MDIFLKRGRNRARLRWSGSTSRYVARKAQRQPLGRCSSLAAPFHDAARATSFCSLVCHFRGPSLYPSPETKRITRVGSLVGSSSRCHMKNYHAALIVAQQGQIISNSERVAISNLPVSFAFSTLRKSHKKVLTPAICLVLDRAVPRCRGHDDDERLEDSA